MKNILCLTVSIFAIIGMSITACASSPVVEEGNIGIKIRNISDDDFAVAALYDESFTLIGAMSYKGENEVSIDYKADIFNKYDNADHIKLFVWSEKQEPRMTAYDIDLSRYIDSEPESRDIKIQIDERTLYAALSDNSSADAFLELLKSGPITVNMTRYGDFEQVGSLPTSLPRNDERITTEPGDIIIYQGNSITIYYGVNTWSYTRLGKVKDITQQEIRDILDVEGVTAVFSIESK